MSRIPQDYSLVIADQRDCLIDEEDGVDLWFRVLRRRVGNGHTLRGERAPESS